MVPETPLITDFHAGDGDPSQGGVISAFIFEVGGACVRTLAMPFVPSEHNRSKARQRTRLIWKCACSTAVFDLLVADYTFSLLLNRSNVFGIKVQYSGICC